MKYIDAEKLRAEIDAFYTKYKAKFHQNGDSYHLGIIDGLDMAERILDTLEEPVSEDLEEAAKAYTDARDWAKENYLTPYIRQAFKAGAEWQKRKMLKDNPVIMPVEDFQALIDSHAKRVEADYKEKMMEGAVEGVAHPDDCEIWVNLVGYGYDIKDGNKVKVIIVKEEE